MSWQDEDERFLLASVEELDAFLSSGLSNWPLRRSAGMLTVGNLLLATRRLEGLNPASLSDTMIKALDVVKKTLARRPSAVREKIRKEIQARMRVWQSLLEEIRDEGRIDASFSNEVRNRVILELLFEEEHTLEPELESRLFALDEILGALSQPGRFLWDENIQAIFEPNQFWFLYLQNRGAKS